MLDDVQSFHHLFDTIIRTGWSERIWLVQENVLNRYSRVIGVPKLLPREHIGRGRDAYMNLNGNSVEPYAESRRQTLPGLHEALWTHWDRQCRDDRDKVYVLLGVVSYAKEMGIVPKYDKPPA
ncbi:hypothetical protein N0V93_008743 [Gnomoniopsis smithogilvyi]|uniref:Heterokaryon incompatibility domain-containing protein n=1 Tax=Gnomoniopsis smithogilvyi TaxID=1191159 RepID=A0A9W8YNK4_9PEZI|nr:hypothetical protein N0V93_008743 [Gnomoniopsis smithogilvyi]